MAFPCPECAFSITKPGFRPSQKHVVLAPLQPPSDESPCTSLTHPWDEESPDLTAGLPRRPTSNLLKLNNYRTATCSLRPTPQDAEMSRTRVRGLPLVLQEQSGKAVHHQTVYLSLDSSLCQSPSIATRLDKIGDSNRC